MVEYINLKFNGLNVLNLMLILVQYGLWFIIDNGLWLIMVYIWLIGFMWFDSLRESKDTSRLARSRFARTRSVSIITLNKGFLSWG